MSLPQTAIPSWEPPPNKKHWLELRFGLCDPTSILFEFSLCSSSLCVRVLFVPHSKYVDTARTFRLHVPAGYTSAMFTHLPSRSVFIDSDRYVSDDSLGYWVAHELGHLAANTASEEDAEKVAREYRRRLKDARKTDLH
jgi:hypothetical protein